MSEDNTLELINTITEFNDLHNFMKDEHLDLALASVVNLIMKPDIPPAKAALLVVQLQALSAKFQMLSQTYSTILRDKAGTENNHKKNIYYSASDSIDKLVASLKYVARSGGMV